MMSSLPFLLTKYCESLSIHKELGQKWGDLTNLPQWFIERAGNRIHTLVQKCQVCPLKT